MTTKPHSSSPSPEPRIALVCDWLTEVGGAEKVLKALSDLYPSAPIYTSQYRPRRIDWFRSREVKTGWLNLFPAALRRFLGPMRQLYFSHLDLSAYDLIISVTGAEAKSIKKGSACHICYCHVPTQYYWQFYQQYLKNPGFGKLNFLARFFLRLFVRPLRRADLRAAQEPDYFITISSYSARLIKQYYHRDSIIIPPPVDVENFSKNPSHTSISAPENPQIRPVENSVESPRPYHFLIFCRQVNWKRIDLALLACLKTQDHLTIIGDGPEHQALTRLASDSPLIHFYPFMDAHKLRHHLTQADAYIFPSLEPFGIAPVEALAAGCPVVAFRQGGSLDFIQPGKNGLFFGQQTVDSLASALTKFKTLKLDSNYIAQTAQKFSSHRFNTQIQSFISERLSPSYLQTLPSHNPKS